MTASAFKLPALREKYNMLFSDDVATEATTKKSSKEGKEIK